MKKLVKAAQKSGQFTSEHHKALDLHEGASKAEIKIAYRIKSLLHHPDRNPGDPEADERFKKVHEAYDALMGSTLSPEERRKALNDECWKLALVLANLGRMAERLFIAKLREVAANRKVSNEARAMAQAYADALEKNFKIIRKIIEVGGGCGVPRRPHSSRERRPQQRGFRGEYTNRIVAIDKDTITFVELPGKARTVRTFPLAKKPLFIVAGKRATLGDFRAGMFAMVGYNTLGVVQVVKARKGKGSAAG